MDNNNSLTNLLSQAEQLYEEERYDEAFKRYSTLSEEGNLHAQVMVGWMYYHGLGIEKNSEKARYWYSISAQSGSPEAQLYLGGLFMQENDFQQGRECYETLVEQGYPPAYFRLGWIYETGKGCSLDKDRAYSLFSEGAKQGHLPSQMIVAQKLFNEKKGGLQRIKGLFLIIKTYFQTILTAIKDIKSDRLRR